MTKQGHMTQFERKIRKKSKFYLPAQSQEILQYSSSLMDETEGRLYMDLGPG